MIITEIGYNSFYMTRDGKPWLPIMGEMQYSRTRREEWRDSLIKMKMCGVDIVQSYVFWIHHEETEGEWNFEGNCELRAFLKEIKSLGMYMYLRIGPWAHGECRNGGFPDWLLDKGWKLRTNDERYLAKVETFFEKIYEQCKGYTYKENGPIIGIQVENEHGHCGGDTGEKGEEHMRTLTKMLRKIGFEAPLYSATGWGGASMGGLLPMWGGYCEEPWCPDTSERKPSPNYLFKNGRNDLNIASDAGIKYDAADIIEGFPYFTAELGGGVQISRFRRPIITDKDTGALSMCKLGSGMNLFGYYIFHGGRNPIGKHTFMNEYRGRDLMPGWTSDVPEISYDFQAPIDEFGKIRPSYKEIKLMGLMLRDFGEDMAPLETEIPVDEPRDQTDTRHLRYAFRKDGKHGYLFVNNYQRRLMMLPHKNVDIKVRLDDGEIRFPRFDLDEGVFFYWPFNMKIGNSLLKTANATPLCLLNGKSYVFFTDYIPNFRFENERDPNTDLIILSRNDALNSYKISLDKEYLFVSESLVLQTDKGVELIGGINAEFKTYPELAEIPMGYKKVGNVGGLVCYSPIEKQSNIENSVTFSKVGNNEYREYKININYSDHGSDEILSLRYIGNGAKLYMGDEYIGDNFYNGTEWNIALARFGYPTELTLKVEPLTDKTDVYLQEWPKMKNGIAQELLFAKLTTEYRYVAIKNN